MTIPRPSSERAILVFASMMVMMVLIAAATLGIAGEVISGLTGQDEKHFVSEPGIEVELATPIRQENGKPVYPTCTAAGGNILLKHRVWGTETVWDGPSVPGENGCSNLTELRPNRTVSRLVAKDR